MNANQKVFGICQHLEKSVRHQKMQPALSFDGQEVRRSDRKLPWGQKVSSPLSPTAGGVMSYANEVLPRVGLQSLV